MGKNVIIKGADFSANGFKNLLKNANFTVDTSGYLGYDESHMEFRTEAFRTFGLQVTKGRKYVFLNFLARNGCNIVTVASDDAPVSSGDAQFTTPEMVSAITTYGLSEPEHSVNVEFVADSNYILFSVKSEAALDSMALLEM
jgi:hypothetical protein